MKKIIIVSFVLLVALGLTGCGNSSAIKSTTSTEQKIPEQNFDINAYRKKISEYSRQELMQESTRLQVDKSISKQDKKIAFEEIQKRNNELMREQMAQ